MNKKNPNQNKIKGQINDHKILSYLILSTNDGLTIQELNQKFQINYRTLDKRLRKLKKKYYVEMNQNKKWFITTNGCLRFNELKKSINTLNQGEIEVNIPTISFKDLKSVEYINIGSFAEENKIENPKNLGGTILLREELDKKAKIAIIEGEIKNKSKAIRKIKLISED